MATAGVPLKQQTGFSSSVTIEEMTAPRPGAKPRKVVFTGSGLPKKGAKWGGKNTIVKTVYPGNPVASQQVMSSEYDDSKFEGTWRRTMFGRHGNNAIYTDENGNVRRILDPHVLADLMESIYQGGALLKVVWAVSGVTSSDGLTADDSSFKKVRLGRATVWDFAFDTHADLKWETTYEWVSNGSLQSRVSNSLEDSDATKAFLLLTSIFDSLSFAANTSFLNSIRDVPNSANRFTLGKLEQLATLPERTVHKVIASFTNSLADFKRLADIAKRVKDQPAAIESALAAFATNTIAIVNQYAQDFGTKSLEHKSNTSSPSACVRAQTRGASVLDQTRKAGDAANDIIDKATKRIAAQGRVSVRESSFTRPGDVLGVHVCRTNQTPQVVSQRWYGTPANAVAILRMNKLPWYTAVFRRGQILFIPNVTGMDARTRL